MNKRYIDFVPASRKPGAKTGPKRASSAVAARKVATRPATKSVAKPAPKPKFTRREVDDVPIEKIFAEKPQKTAASKGLKEPKFGVIEDYQPKFVATKVEKRPLGAKAAVRSAKASGGPAKIASASTRSAKTSAKPLAGVSVGTNTQIAGPMITKYLNKNANGESGKALPKFKPLADDDSEPVFKKEGKKNTKKGPVTIIEKPEKDSKVGMIVAIILTIILGAAAGTVAFLLLPK